MTFKNMLRRTCLTAITLPFLLGGFATGEAKAEWYRSIYSGQHDWIDLRVNPGTYSVNASTLMDLGDVDIALYDSTGQNLLLEDTSFGDARLVFTTSTGGHYKVKYSMFACVNPFGACAVEINTFSQ